VTPARLIPILPEFDPDAIRQRLQRHEFFWADFTLAEEVSLDQIQKAFALEAGAVDALGMFGRRAYDARGPRRRVYVDEEHVVFPFWCVGRPEAEVSESRGALDIYEVKVLVHGDYLLTIHEEARDLVELVGKKLPGQRSESYTVYVVLESMTSTFFRALLVIQDAMGALEADLLESSGRTRQRHQETIRGVRLRLTELRTVAGPGRVLFDRASGEVEQVQGLETDRRGYFDRINRQLDRVIDGLDAAGQGLSNAVEVELNETTYRLTIVATIFLPLTFLVGFFGMNFGWMVGEIDTAAAFWLFGVGGCVLAVALIVGFLVIQNALAGPRAGRSR
jgi:magnesium transporter